jgi:hypothetical protein
MGSKQPADKKEWIALGQANGWCSLVVCDTHVGLPRSDKEWQSWDNGEEPCAFVVRVDDWLDESTD